MIAPHQQAFADTARDYEGLFWGTGCGKTRGALYSMKSCDGSILIIAPKTTVQKKQWQHEASVLGLNEPRVISKEEFRRDHKILPRYKGIIFEEAHHVFGVSPNTRFRNKKRIPKASQLFEASQWYLETHKPDKVICASATPNKTPMSIYAAATLLGYTPDFYEFRDTFYIRLPMPNEIYAPKRDKETIDRLADYTRKIGQVLRLDDIKDVPPQTYITETFDLSTGQIGALKTLPARFTDQSALRLKRHQIENGLLYEDVFDPIAKKVARKTERFPCAKVDYILERAYEFPKMIIFANYTEQVNIIADALRKDGRNVLIMDSSTKDRKEVERLAESADSAYIVAQASVSSEWEFKTAGVVIWASLDNKSLSHIQGMGRVQRYDAVKANLYIYLVTDYPQSVDKKWHATIMLGQDVNEALFDYEK